MATLTLAERRQTVESAQGALDELGIDQTRPVDVFEAIDSLGLTLTFAPLDNLLGAIIPTGNGGVLLTTSRGVPVQRYTAAHEIGHWFLDGESLALDGEAEINGLSPELRERKAQLFASYFLMPPPLIRRVAAEHGVLPHTAPSPEQVYLLARDVGASFEAVVRQLGNMEYIGSGVVGELVNSAPLAAKTKVGLGRRPLDGRSDVWAVDSLEFANAAELKVSAGDEITVILPENRTTGYTWLLPEQEEERRASPRPIVSEPSPFGVEVVRAASPPEVRTREAAPAVSAAELFKMLPAEEAAPSTLSEVDDAVAIVGDRYFVGWREGPASLDPITHRRAIANDSVSEGPMERTRDALHPRIGATGRRLISLKVNRSGRWSLKFFLARQFDTQEPALIEYGIVADVRPSPEDLQRSRLKQTDIDVVLPGDPLDDEEFSVVAADV